MNPSQDSTRGLDQLEGYLLWAAEVEDARRQAGRFAEQLPWLTTAQCEEVERVYTADRLEVSRAILVRICERAAELRGAYEHRYRQLRARCVAAALVGVASGAGAVVLAFLLEE
ncbi:hypothetical protein [Streptomyces sp. NEAU-W12]|uniref:hypothetical protein n=1 Tax=Streptomyces sp. NEAU-W12 TaxID=2994668 RepID=UPI00224B37A5|nr:hypothetical protein [Streptomyces sp. NEAU-W12]MCX2927110.1 hypothetical protein [Streptomyces sp. NEAU-W12]